MLGRSVLHLATSAARPSLFYSMGRRAPAARWMSFDLDSLLEKNRYGGDDKKETLSSIMAAKKYGGNSGPKVEIDLAPVYPLDIDVGPLFCVKADRCFLDGGNRCGKYQQGNRNKGMLQDLFTSVNETGFFFIYNTMVEDQTLQNMYEHTLRFHARDDDESFKETLRADVTDCLSPGWISLKEHPVFDAGLLANSTSFNVPGKHAEGSAARKWPPVAAVGEDFQKDVSRYYDQLDLMATQLSKGFATMLDLPEGFFHEMRTEKSLSRLEMIYYPPAKAADYDAQSKEVPGADTDGVLFSIVNQNCPGLQIQDKQGRWCNVRCGSERFIVLIGDALEIITGGALKATRHRNVCVPHNRAMLTFRAALDADALLKPHKAYDSGDGTYQPITQLEHGRKRRAKKLELQML